MNALAAFYVAALVWLAGFFAAGWTGGAPVPVAVGTLGLLAWLVALAAVVGERSPRMTRYL